MNIYNTILICLFVLLLYVPKTSAMVMVGRSVHLTTLFSWASLNKLEQGITSSFVHILSLVTDNNPS